MAGCARTIWNSGDQAQVDNCPGYGASWGWIYNGSNDLSRAKLWVQFYDGNSTYIVAEYGKTFSRIFPKDIWRYQLCKLDLTGRQWGCGPMYTW
jgi:hypothetical protein